MMNSQDYYEQQQHINSLKNTDEQPNRGGCLTIALGFVVIISFAGFFGNIDTITRISRFFAPSLWLYIALVAHFALVISAIALLNWKEWGYYGLIVGFGCLILAGLSIGEIAVTIGNFIDLLVILVLVRPIRDYLE